MRTYKVQEIIGRQSGGPKVALTEITSQCLQPLQSGEVFDAFGNHLDIKAVRHFNPPNLN